MESYVAACMGVAFMFMVLIQGTTASLETSVSKVRLPAVAVLSPRKRNASSFKACGHKAPLANHLLLVLVEPRVSLVWVIQVFGRAWVRLAQVGADIVTACQGCVVTALHWDRLRLRVIRHLYVENKRDCAIDLCCLAQEGVGADWEGAALITETPAGLHLPEEANLAILFRKHPDTEKVSTRDKRFIEVMAGSPSALGSCILGHRGINSALVTELVDAQEHTARLFMVGICGDLVCFGGAQHSGLDGFLDECSLTTRNSDPSTVQRIGLGHITRLRQASRPRQRAARQLEGLVTVIKSLTHCHLPLGELRARIMEIIVTKCAVIVGVLQGLVHQ